ncbi:zinc-binding dehydrogenase [Xylophilus rhododendri]|uniref:Zinc-binding dehydrogenase n=1 Tax=Xylophilus rhododendri TaxID=2697032 RepID=A0A857J361_9BURK|nr:NAD(P)H-quinone oxidoreductase [Xylophilus rhododendri]QHI97693.1 zinc-binding dehydrogenase [Xylophilus rhododendri]
MEIPSTHRCVEVPVPGAAEALLLVERPVPVPGPGELLIRVFAAGVNRADVKQREGVYDMPAGASIVPGLEVSGEVAARGAGSSRFALGDRVCALLIGGAYAEYCVVPEVQCLPLPEGLGWVEAAGLPETVFTVWMALFEQARLQPGEVVLVHGGASGIGTTAIQMAKLAGARVFATAGSAEKCARCVALGAELAVNYHEQDFAEVLAGRLGSRGVDVILDIVGAPYVARNLKLLAIEGRLCYLAGDAGRTVQMDLLPVIQKRISVTGASLRRRPVAEKGRLAEAIERRVWPWVASGALQAQIGATLPLEQVADAHRALEAGEVIGKMILTTRALTQAG